MSSGFRTEIRRYTIYCILDDIQKSVFVGKSYAKNPKSHYYSHLRGEHALTRGEFFDDDVLRPEFYILEIIYCTGSVAFKHILAWYNYFEELGYCVLTDDKAGFMVDNMSYETQKIYEDVCVPYSLDEVLTRTVEEPETPKDNTPQKAKKKDKEELKQFNFRVKESVAQAFRSFCEEKGVTQSEGLCLLLLAEDFSERSKLMDKLQDEINAKDAEIVRLQQANKELTDPEREKESWALHQRKEWARIAETMLQYVVDHSINSQSGTNTVKRELRMNRLDGRELFHKCPYPQAGDCYEVTISDLVRGFERKKDSPDHKNYIPFFICGYTVEKIPIKFRWYTETKIIGIKPNKEAIAHWGDSWLLGCITSKDGAADLVCAVPLQGLSCAESLMLNTEAKVLPQGSEGNNPSLTDIIASARKKQNDDIL